MGFAILFNIVFYVFPCVYKRGNSQTMDPFSEPSVKPKVADRATIYVRVDTLPVDYMPVCLVFSSHFPFPFDVLMTICIGLFFKPSFF